MEAELAYRNKKRFDDREGEHRWDKTPVGK